MASFLLQRARALSVMTAEVWMATNPRLSGLGLQEHLRAQQLHDELERKPSWPKLACLWQAATAHCHLLPPIFITIPVCPGPATLLHFSPAGKASLPSNRQCASAVGCLQGLGPISYPVFLCWGGAFCYVTFPSLFLHRIPEVHHEEARWATKERG